MKINIRSFTIQHISLNYLTIIFLIIFSGCQESNSFKKLDGQIYGNYVAKNDIAQAQGINGNCDFARISKEIFIEVFEHQNATNDRLVFTQTNSLQFNLNCYDSGKDSLLHQWVFSSGHYDVRTKKEVKTHSTVDMKTYYFNNKSEIRQELSFTTAIIGEGAIFKDAPEKVTTTTIGEPAFSFTYTLLCRNVEGKMSMTMISAPEITKENYNQLKEIFDTETLPQLRISINEWESETSR